jgi:hypothetical protein
MTNDLLLKLSTAPTCCNAVLVGRVQSILLDIRVYRPTCYPGFSLQVTLLKISVTYFLPVIISDILDVGL